MEKTLTHLTDLEKKVLSALWDSSAGNGHDFGLIEDCRGSVSVRQLSGVIASLSKKKIVYVHEAVVTDSGRWTQTYWGDDWTPETVAELFRSEA